MKRVLIITYYWPPTAGSGVQRWLKMSGYLPQFGWQPVIYTPSNPEATLTDDSLLADICPEAEILSRPIREPYRIFRIFTGGSEKKQDTNPINNTGRKSIMMRISLWIRANIFIPDPRCLWVRPSVRYLEKYLAEHPVDAIVSTGPPHSMHLIARGLHRRTAVRWIADFRDPWTRIFYFKHLPLTKRSAARHNRLEKSVLQEADKVVVVTDGMRRDMEALLGPQASAGRLHVIENGYDAADFAGIEPLLQEGRFHLVHTGLFSSEGNPRNLWAVLSELCRELPDFAARLKITLAGRTDAAVLESIAAEGLTSYIEDLGYIPHKEANRLQKGADLLLLPLREEPEAASILTGKYFEYLAAGRPIAAFGPHGSTLEESLQKTGAGRIFDWSETAPLKDYIRGIYTGQIRVKPSPAVVAAYTRKSLTSKMVALLQDRPSVSVIVATDRNMAIGRNNQLLWHISEDLKYFKRTTSGHPVIMGYNTWLSIGAKPLPGRANIVVSRRHSATSGCGAKFCTSLEDALREAGRSGSDEVFVLGGGQLYQSAMPLADRLYITEVDTCAENPDTYFPAMDPGEWREVERSGKAYDEKSGYCYSFVIYTRL